MTNRVSSGANTLPEGSREVHVFKIEYLSRWGEVHRGVFATRMGTGVPPHLQRTMTRAEVYPTSIKYIGTEKIRPRDRIGGYDVVKWRPRRSKPGKTFLINPKI